MECAGSPPSPFAGGCASRMILGKGEGWFKLSPRKPFLARWSSDEPFAAGMAAILPSDSGDDPARDGVFRAARTRMPRAAIRQTGEAPTASFEEIGDEPGHSLPFLASRGFRRKRRQRMGSGYCDLVCGRGGGQLRGRSKRHPVQLSRPADADQRALIAERVARTTNRDEPAARVVLRLRGAGRALRLPIATTVPAERRYHHRRGRVFGRYRECGAGRKAALRKPCASAAPRRHDARHGVFRLRPALTCGGPAGKFFPSPPAQTV